MEESHSLCSRFNQLPYLLSYKQYGSRLVKYLLACTCNVLQLGTEGFSVMHIWWTAKLKGFHSLGRKCRWTGLCFVCFALYSQKKEVSNFQNAAFSSERHCNITGIARFLQPMQHLTWALHFVNDIFINTLLWVFWWLKLGVIVGQMGQASVSCRIAHWTKTQYIRLEHYHSWLTLRRENIPFKTQLMSHMQYSKECYITME